MNNSTTKQQTGARGNIGSIFIENVLDGHGLIKDLQKWAKEPIAAKNTRQHLIIQVRTMEDHQAVVSRLKVIKQRDSDTEFFFHRATPERRYKLIIRGLSPGMNIEELKQDITRQGFRLFHASEMMKKDEGET